MRNQFKTRRASLDIRSARGLWVHEEKGGTSSTEGDETLVNVSFDLWEISRIAGMCNLTADPNKALQSRSTARPRGRRETFCWLAMGAHLSSA